jgi:hypothetical protein
MNRLSPEKLHINYSPCVELGILVIPHRLSGFVCCLRRL